MYKKVPDEIKEIINKYKYDKKIRMYSNKYYFRDNSIYRSINNNNDVEKTLNDVTNNIRYYENFKYPLVDDDIESLERSLAKYEIAIFKVLACFDNPYCNFNYKADELMQLINNWDIFHDRIHAIRRNVHDVFSV